MSVWKKICYVMMILSCVFACSGCGKETPLSFSTSEEIVSVEDEEIPPSQEQKKGTQAETKVKADDSNIQEKQTEEKSDEPLAVYICGAVQHPGVYEVPQKSRIYQVIERAGGLREDAAEDCVNQADAVTDAQMIKIYTKEEMAAVAQQVPEMAETASENATGQQTDSGLVNLNTASKEELMTLSGIGEAKAESIIKYRETNGAFGKIEDIKNITGIKDGVFEKIKDSITV